MLKKIALAVLILCGVANAQQTATTALDPAQIYNTGNIVVPTTTTSGSTWANGVYQDQLTCWAWGNPGYCGPNAIVRPDNNINFSFGMTDLYQVRAIADVLPNSGAGLRVNGYTFGFTAKNGNGWDNGQQDYLAAYVLFSGNSGPPAFYKTYDLNSKFNWTTFSWSETFATPFASKDLKTVQYGIVGMDTNYWAGPYGPEVQNVNFSLKYSVDPCAVNVLSSPTCPGYLDELAKLAPASAAVVTDPVTTTAISPIASTTIVTDPVASTVNVTSLSSVGQPSVVASVVAAPAPVTTTTSSATSSSSSTSSSSQTTKESSGSGGSNVGLALSVISKNSERDAAGAAIAQTAVAQAQQAANQVQQEATSVASNAASNSLSANAVSGSSQQSSGNGIRVNQNSNSTNFSLQSGVTSLASIVSGPSTNGPMLTQQQSSSVGLTVLNNQPVITNNQSIQQSTNNNTNTFALPLLQPTQTSISLTAPVTTTTTTQTQSQPTTLPTNSSLSQSTETYSTLPPNFLTDKTNPMTDIIEGKQMVPQSGSVAMIGPSVNKNTQDNDAAGGVKIERMATAPTGYGDYLNFTMRDVAFYAPKEVYKNQRNVDNQRALRTLTNDSKHKEMVEMQYGR
jgi:hypothetical protein